MYYSPWQSGRKDYWDGLMVEDNPYDVGTEEWEQWRDGWWEASDEDMDDNRQEDLDGDY